MEKLFAWVVVAFTIAQCIVNYCNFRWVKSLQDRIDMLEHSKMRKSPTKSLDADKELQEACDRIYERYGNDLAAFFRDVQEEISKGAMKNERKT